MADRDPRDLNEDQSPATQIGEDKGRIKQPQQQEGAEKNLPRGSEAETHARK